MIVVNVATSSESSVACSVPDCTVTDEPTSAWIRRTSSSGATPASAATCTASSSPFLSSSAWAVGMSKMAKVAPPMRAQVAVLRDADDLVLPGGAERGDADPVARSEVLVLRDRLVDRDLPPALRPAALDEVQRVEAVELGGRLDAERERRRAAGVDRLAVRLDQLGLEVLHRAGGHLHAVDAADLLEDALGDRGGRRRLALEADARLLAGHDRVRVGVGVDEDRVERLVDRVREHVGAAHHRDAQDDRDRGQQRPELPPCQAPERDADHRSVISSTAAST